MEILVLFDSKGGNTYELVKEIAEGIREVDGMEPRVRRVREIMPIEVIRSRQKWSDFYDFKTREVQEATLDDLVETEGLMMGSPTRFGNITSALGNFIESTGPLWAKGTLVGKAAGVFTSSDGVHGAQETTLVSMMFPLIHLGYILVPLGYTDPQVATTERGGTPYGASSVTSLPGYDGPTEIERHLCRVHAKRVAEVTKKLRS